MGFNTDNSKEPYIIAETAFNHQGDITYLFGMIDDIAEMGLNAVKFQLLLNPDSFFDKEHPLKGEMSKWLFSREQWDELIKHSNKRGLDAISLCNDVESIHYALTKSAVSAIELHASGLNDFFMLDALLNWDRQVILGIGGSTLDEIQYAIEFLEKNGKKDIILMYGFQAYPTDYHDANLAKMIKIHNLFGLPVGYADHTRFDDPCNEIVSIIPAAMGFSVLEKHYTLDPGVERIDFHAAVGKEQMLRIKKLLQLVLTARGTGHLQLSAAELAYGNVGPVKTAIVAKRLIKKGQKLSLDNLCFKRTLKESTLRQNQFGQLLGLEAVTNIRKDEPIQLSHVRYVFQKPDLGSFTHIKHVKK